MNSKELGQPVRGTLAVADDPGWFTQFIDEAVAVVYFLGDKPSGVPAECFTYHRMELREDGGSEDFARHFTKHGLLIETGSSVAVSPPLVTRGHRGQYRVNLNRPASVNLLAIIGINPMNRLVVAVRQYFRTQLSDLFSSTPAEDFATYCSCLEAASDIDGRHDAGEKFVAALCAQFGQYDELKEFARGLYCTRSVYVHGVANETIAAAVGKEASAYRSFETLRGHLTLVRQMTRAVLLRQLGELPNTLGFLTPDSPDILISKVLRSRAIWERCRPLLTRRRAADELQQMEDAAFQEVEELAVLMKEWFAWKCVVPEVEPGAVYRAISTCALLLTRLTQGQGPIYEASVEAGTAATAKDGKALSGWCDRHADWENVIVVPRDRLSTVQALMWALAMYFVPR